MIYEQYPNVSSLHPELSGSELEFASKLKLLEDMQVDFWGERMNDGSILKPSDPQLMFNWIAGGVFQYKYGPNVISSTFALSSPSDDQFTDDDGITYSGLGFEYFIEHCHGQSWPVEVLVNIAKVIFSPQSFVMQPGMFIRWDSGFVPVAQNTAKVGLLCYKAFDVDIPDGRIEFCKLVPLGVDDMDEYISLGDEKSNGHRKWFDDKGLDHLVPIEIETSN